MYTEKQIQPEHDIYILYYPQVKAIELEVDSKPHLVSDGCVPIRFKMLTYFVYAPLFNRIDTLPSKTIWDFDIISSFHPENKKYVLTCIINIRTVLSQKK